jgi:hypothetical protein
MKIQHIVGLILLATTIQVHSETVIRPTFPGTDIPDLTKPALVRDGNVIYESYPGLNVRDYSKPAQVIEDNGNGTSTVYETFAPGDIPNKMKGGYTIQHEH